MNRSKIVAIIAYIMIIVGLIGILWGIKPTEQSETVTIPAGDTYYRYWLISFWLNGHISGDFEVTGAGTVELFVLDSEQYEQYAYDMMPSDYLDMANGTVGSFSADMPDTSTYYIVVNHGEGFGTIDQTIRITIKVSGLDLTWLIIGVVLLAVGAVLAILSRKMKFKEAATAPVPAAGPQPTDVTMFDSKKKP
jgi:hypothetical protein